MKAAVYMLLGALILLVEFLTMGSHAVHTGHRRTRP